MFILVFVAFIVLHFYRDFTANTPDELTTYASFVRTPDGRPVIGLTLCYAGPRAEGERVIAPLRQFGSPLIDRIRPMSYYELITMLDAGAPDGRNYYETANTLPALTDEAIDLLVAYGSARTSPFSQLMIQHIHGAAARVAPDATAFALRFDHYVTGFVAAWEEGPADAHIAWARWLRGDHALRDARRVCQLSARRRRESRAGRLWRELRAAVADQGQVRPGQRLSAESEH